MSTRSFFFSNANFALLVVRLLAKGRVVAPVGRNLMEIDQDNLTQIALDGYRTIESFKSYIFCLTEKVAANLPVEEGTLTLLGPRGCDLEALEVLDRVFLEGEYRDPFYEARRRELLLISTDCTSCGETCFCTLVKGQPYPIKLFDLNLTPVEGGFIVEVGSERGKRLIEENQELFDEHQAEAKVQAKAEVRDRTLALLAEKNQAYRLKMDLTESHKRNLENQSAWRRLTKDCVECSACNFICPTCSCFLLVDSRQSRDKVWDACLKTGYARVAGGANSRPKLYERLQNRYHCKFDYSCDRLGRYTCVGCGRCIDGCAGNIDMRKIFVELAKQAPLTAKLE